MSVRTNKIKNTVVRCRRSGEKGNYMRKRKDEEMQTWRQRKIEEKDEEKKEARELKAK